MNDDLSPLRDLVDRCNKLQLEHSALIRQVRADLAPDTITPLVSNEIRLELDALLQLGELKRRKDTDALYMYAAFGIYKSTKDMISELEALITEMEHSKAGKADLIAFREQLSRLNHRRDAVLQNASTGACEENEICDLICEYTALAVRYGFEASSEDDKGFDGEVLKEVSILMGYFKRIVLTKS